MTSGSSQWRVRGFKIKSWSSYEMRNLYCQFFFPFTWLVLRWDWEGDVARVARGWGNWQRSSFKTIGMGSQDFNLIRGQRSGLTLVFCSLLALDGYPKDHGYQFGDLSRNTIVHPQLWRSLCVAEIHGNFQPDT